MVLGCGSLAAAASAASQKPRLLANRLPANRLPAHPWPARNTAGAGSRRRHAWLGPQCPGAPCQTHLQAQVLVGQDLLPPAEAGVAGGRGGRGTAGWPAHRSCRLQQQTAAAAAVQYSCVSTALRLNSAAPQQCCVPLVLHVSTVLRVPTAVCRSRPAARVAITPRHPTTAPAVAVLQHPLQQPHVAEGRPRAAARPQRGPRQVARGWWRLALRLPSHALLQLLQRGSQQVQQALCGGGGKGNATDS